ncbi:MAG: pirin family protein [Salinisphaeraceae bacterium]|nr:pirin family protein [Salinisphaeraceae bacterium]
MTNRKIKQMIHGVPTSDGAGVKLTRSVGSQRHLRVDPFLMLDEFASDNASDYIAGFPPHPHRGFETVTYMLDGHMLHEDHMGNRGDLLPGDVQWMTAGRGIIHSEMPQQEEGRMRGFQLWINLPAAEKMQPAAYRDIPAAQIPQVALKQGGSVKVIAGRYQQDGQSIAGPINGAEAIAERMSTDPLYLDVQLEAGQAMEQAILTGYNAFLFAYEGSLQVGEQAAATHDAAVLGDGDQVVVQAGEQGARFLLLAGKPLNEPIAQYGPFVMNSMEEVEQAIRDYQSGALAQAS